jgi:hypothetical protein
MPDRVWVEVLQAAQLAAFADLPANILANTPAWRRVYDSNDPASEPLPSAAAGYALQSLTPALYRPYLKSKP